MKKLIGVFILIVFLLQTNCTFQTGKLDALWFYISSTGAGSGEDSSLTPASFMDLRPDKTYTLDFGGFDYGHWERKDSLLKLKSSKGYTLTLFIDHFFRRELRLGKGTILNFEARPGQFASQADNPFSVQNNQWRITATKKENEQELKSRLNNHFKFYEAYFRWALDNDMSSIDGRSTPSLIKIYGNRFTLKSFDELPAPWRSYFFDEGDCRKANEIIKNIFDHHDIAWANTDNKYKMFISAFQQLEGLVK